MDRWPDAIRALAELIEADEIQFDETVGVLFVYRSLVSGICVATSTRRCKTEFCLVNKKYV